ncbi:hypothetical protein H8356DRAFT_1338080 [Neocallimastix lanati (nom. inval.)]|nr:hypothetical protein H8356DRAFT_1338080 [Neocallimastix sp. JGI-2020a]
MVIINNNNSNNNNNNNNQCYIPDFSKSKEYIISKHRKSRKSTKKSTKKKSTTKTITKTATKATGKAKQTSYTCDKHVVVKHECKYFFQSIIKKLNPNLNCDNLRSNTKICVSSKNAGNNKTPNFSNSKQITL